MHYTLLASLSFIVAHTALSAQCTNPWLRESGVPGADSSIRAVTRWDPDGPGPQTERVVMAGSFFAAGRVIGNRIAAFDPVANTWTSFGTGADLNVAALLALPNGDLVAGGFFTTMNGVSCSRIAYWNGINWSPLGTGLGGSVLALAQLSNGDLVAGGSFATAGGAPATCVARWNGASWSAMGAGLNGGVSALALQPNGTLVAGGGAGSPGSASFWNGTSWAALGASPPSTIRSLLALPSGDLIAGGDFVTDGLGAPMEHVARWNGTAWSAMHTGCNAAATSFLGLPNGDVLAGGNFGVASGVQARGLARWNGSTWSSVGSALVGNPSPSSVDAMALLANGDVITAGAFTQIDGVFAMNVARYDGAAFHALDVGPDREVLAATKLPSGDLVVAGSFATIGGTLANRIARFDGTSWQPLGSGLAPFPVLQPTAALLVEPNGDLVVGGDFTFAGGVQVNGIARWNGTSWSAFGTGMTLNSRVRALARMPNGDLVAGGTFTTAGGVPASGIARWNGTSWSAFGNGATQHPVFAIPATVSSLLVAQNGDLYAGGLFTFMNGVAASRIARFDGTAWSPLGSGADGDVLALAELPNGDIVAAGSIGFVGGVTAPGIARWNGTSWNSFGAGLTGVVQAVQVLPGGDLVATGTILASGGTLVGNLARWNGSTWTGFGAGLAATGRTLALEQNGDLFVGGEFLAVDGAVSARFAHLSTTCPASNSIGTPGCGVTLAVQDGAWIGGTFRARATGLPALGFAFHATSVTPIAAGLAPLSIVFAQALPGCDLLVAPDFVGFTSVQNGTAISSMPMPSDPFLVGLVFYHQLVPVELDGLGQAIGVTATDSLRVTIGAF
ncbi:MAG: hypothetical protein ABL997_13665 [Planctomycetota bacterium]